jgi:anti-sigma factor RsiW
MTIHPLDDLAAHSIGALDPPEERRVREHLAGCESCRAEVASFDEVAWAIAELAALAARAAPPSLRDDVRVIVGAPSPSPAARALGAIRAALQVRVPLAVPLALVLVLGLALAGYGSARADADAYARAVAGVLDGHVVALAPAPGSEARGTLVMPAAGAPYLILRLPAPPAGKTWEAWVVRGGQPLAAGISGDRSGVVTLVLSQPVRAGDAVAVTLEDAGGVPLPRGAIVLEGRV